MSKHVNKEVYSQFLIATQGRHSAVWISELLNNKPAHDAFTRWLSTAKLQPHILWEYAQSLVDTTTGYLIFDDTVLDKWYQKSMKLVYRQYSGTHHALVDGIGVVSMLWTNKKRPTKAEHVPCDFRVYDPKTDGKTKHQHVRDMIESAYLRGFTPQMVVMDAWYADIGTFKLLRSIHWTFVSGIEKNRKVSMVPHAYRSVERVATEDGIVVHLKAFDFVKVFKIVRPNGDSDYLVTNNLLLSSRDIRDAAIHRWKVEEYHRGAKQTVGIAKCQARSQRSQRNHIFCSILSFLALEKWRLETGYSWYEVKQQIITQAMASYLHQPFIPLPQKALT